MARGPARVGAGAGPDVPQVGDDVADHGVPVARPVVDPGWGGVDRTPVAGQAAAVRNGASEASSEGKSTPEGPRPPPIGTRSSRVPCTATTVSGAGAGQSTVRAPATGPIPASAPGRAQAHA